MPVILSYKGYRFFFFSNEGDPLEPVHIHVRHGENVAKYWLKPSISLDSSYGFNSRGLREIEALVREHRDTFERAWNVHFNL